jgi:AmmeMemoRadiSam system protein A
MDTSEKEFYLNEGEKKLLLKIARESLSHYLQNRKYPDYDESTLPNQLLQACGAFVTIYKNGSLAGCIGRMSSDLPLYRLIEKMAVSSALNDSRFPVLKFEELNQVRIELSILSPMQKVTDPHKIELGKHGIYIKQGQQSGTFLPQVAESTNWTLEEFLGHCSRDKAGIGWDGWKNAELFRYTVEIIKD